MNALRRFTGDLWHADNATVVAATKAILAKRGLTVAEVFPLTTGLYSTARLGDGRTVNVDEQEIRRYAWNHANR